MLLALGQSQAAPAAARLASAAPCPMVVEAPPPILAGARGAGCVPPRL